MHEVLFERSLPDTLFRSSCSRFLTTRNDEVEVDAERFGLRHNFRGARRVTEAPEPIVTFSKLWESLPDDRMGARLLNLIYYC